MPVRGLIALCRKSRGRDDHFEVRLEKMDESANEVVQSNT